MVLTWNSGMGMEPSEKETIFSREMGNGEILETEKKESQKLGQIQICFIESVTNHQEKAHPLFLAPNLDLVHQWLDMARRCVKVRA